MSADERKYQEWLRANIVNILQSNWKEIQAMHARPTLAMRIKRVWRALWGGRH